MYSFIHSIFIHPSFIKYLWGSYYVLQLEKHRWTNLSETQISKPELVLKHLFKPSVCFFYTIIYWVAYSKISNKWNNIASTFSSVLFFYTQHIILRSMWNTIKQAWIYFKTFLNLQFAFSHKGYDGEYTYIWANAYLPFLTFWHSEHCLRALEGFCFQTHLSSLK